MHKFETILENILIVVAVALIVFGSIGLIIMPCIIISEKKEYDKANTIMQYQNGIYYIITYEYEGDYIKAIDVDGHSVMLPKDNTVIKEKNN